MQQTQPQTPRQFTARKNCPICGQRFVISAPNQTYCTPGHQALAHAFRMLERAARQEAA